LRREPGADDHALLLRPERQAQDPARRRPASDVGQRAVGPRLVFDRARQPQRPLGSQADPDRGCDDPEPRPRQLRRLGRGLQSQPGGKCDVRPGNNGQAAPPAVARSVCVRAPGRPLKQRTGDPWKPAARYGQELPPFTVNLVVRDVPRAVAFLTPVLNATIHYADPDFAAINVGGVEMMLHADHTYDKHPWYGPLTSGARRGLGAELRVFGIDPDGVERRAREHGANVVQPATTKGHGWREVMVEDPDGYLWAVGVPAPSTRGSWGTSTRRGPPPGGRAPRQGRPRPTPHRPSSCSLRSERRR